jgi:hypothetical protein
MKIVYISIVRDKHLTIGKVYDTDNNITLSDFYFITDDTGAGCFFYKVKFVKLQEIRRLKLKKLEL